jgi:hypothetical protein
MFTKTRILRLSLIVLTLAAGMRAEDRAICTDATLHGSYGLHANWNCHWGWRFRSGGAFYL